MDDIYRQRLLLDVENAEKKAKTFLSNVTGIDKLLVSDSFYSFCSLTNAPVVSIRGVDKMPLEEKKIWIACRLWAVCQKIKSMDNPPLQAGFELARYISWLAHPGKSLKEAGASGGSKPKPYSTDLNALIEEIIQGNMVSNSIVQTVFNKLPGKKHGIIEKITKDRIDDNEVLIVYWEGDRAGNPDRTEMLGYDAIRKRVKNIQKE